MRFFRIALAMVSASLLATNSAGGVNFLPDSPLASGHWVKVKTEAGGMYSISYDRLREMGFQTPERVGVFSNSGTPSPLNFSGNYGEAVYSDAVRESAVIHRGNRLYFYVPGTVNITYNATTSSFIRPGKNIYTDSQYILLGEVDSPVAAKNMGSATEGSVVLPSAKGYFYHELDSAQNHGSGGQLFWGENLLNRMVGFNFSNANLAEGSHKVTASFYATPACLLSVAYGSNPNELSTYNGRSSSSSIWKEMAFSFQLNSEAGQTELTPYIKGFSDDEKIEDMNLDYLLVTYNKQFPQTGAQVATGGELYYFPSEAGKSYGFSTPAGYEVIDVSNPFEIRECEAGAGGGISFVATAPVSKVLVCDLERDSREITSWKKVRNTNLHNRQGKKTALAIISTEEFLDAAERIADLHSRYDGIETEVVCVKDLYNEFTGGMPDPMAFRSYVRLLVDSHPEFRNVLFVGTMSGDNRKSSLKGDYDERIVCYEEKDLRIDRDPCGVFDFAAMTQDQLDLSALYLAQLSVGTGILSWQTQGDADRVISKIENYLKDGDKAWWVSENIALGGLGDVHMHDHQAVTVSNKIRNLSGEKALVSNLSIDAYGIKNARKKFIDLLNRGSMLTVYFGHGGPSMMGKDYNFFTATDAAQLSTRKHGFIFMGGCEFSAPDLLERGMGESFVLDSRSGLMGTICSTRTTWSNQNANLADKLITNWFPDKLQGSVRSVGEVYAGAKNACSYPNELAFILVSDPALKLPTETRRIVVEKGANSVAPKQLVTVSGSIQDGEGNIDRGFNGKIVAKLNQKPVTLMSYDLETRTYSTDKDSLLVPYTNNRIISVEGRVKNGVYSLRLPIPSDIVAQSGGEGKEVTMHLCAVDDKTLNMGLHSSQVLVSVPGNDLNGSMEQDIDNTPPSVGQPSYSAAGGVVKFSVFDEEGIRPQAGNVKVRVGGKNQKVRLLHDEFYHGLTNSLDVEFDAQGLIDGLHTMAVEVADATGNSATYTFEFSKQPYAAPLTLDLDRKLTLFDSDERFSVSVEGDTSGELVLIVQNCEGQEICSLPFPGSQVTFLPVDSDGLPLSPGLYRMMVRENAPQGDYKYSEWFNFAVVQ